MKRTVLIAALAVLTACGGTASSDVASPDVQPVPTNTTTTTTPTPDVPIVQPIDAIPTCAPSGTWDVVDSRASYSGDACADTTVGYTPVVTISCPTAPSGAVTCTWTENGEGSSSGSATGTLDVTSCTFTMITNATADGLNMQWTRRLVFDVSTATGTVIEVDSSTATCSANYNTIASKR
jgi:hypothetical protein